MSYRSFKRVLGETNLERKCRFLFGGCLLLLITGSFYWYGQQTEALVYEQNRNTGRLLVDTHMTRTHWEVYNSPSESAISTPDDRFLAVKLGEELQSFEYVGSFLYPDPDPEAPTAPGYEGPDRASRPVDEFEYSVLDRFEDGYDEPLERRLADRQQYHYYQAVRAKKTCLTYGCHDAASSGRGFGLGSTEPLHEGDLMAVAKVVINDGPTQDRLHLNRAILLSTAIITVFLAMVAAYVIVRYVIAKPLRHLKDVSEAISRGSIDQRAEIRTGDEFEELGRAFNRMLRHLVAVQEELRQVNGDLDGKLDELAQANMALFEMNRLKSDFLATMSHELRTPLNSILGFSEVLGSIESLDDKQKRYVRNIQKSGKMLLDMINDILDLAKIESGKMELRLVDFRIEHVIAAQCDLARPLTEKKNIDLETYVESGLPPLHQDQGKVQQILANLLSNAIKFTPEGGRVVVTARAAEPNHLVLVVRDTGVGIAEEDQAVVFEKFRQGRSVLPSGDAITREYSGTGLGLSIVKELCKLLGGEVTLDSAVGKGSTFSVRLPMVLPDQPRVEMPSSEGLIDLSKARRVHFERPASRTLSAGSAPSS